MPGSEEPPHNLWLDVEDLFEYAAAHPRPSGIQRLAFEIYRALQQRHGASGRIHFLRHDHVTKSFVAVPWDAILELFDQLADAAVKDRRGAPMTRRRSGVAPESRGRWMARRLVYRLPAGLRLRLLYAARLQSQACRAMVELVRFAALRAIARVRAGSAPAPTPGSVAGPDASMPTYRPTPSPTGRPPVDFAKLAQPGDVLVALGAPWNHPDYAGLVRAAKMRFGVRFAFLTFDLIPIRRPEWFDAGLVRVFRAWFRSVLPVADMVLAISRSTATDVERFAAEWGIALPAPVSTVPIGTGFSGQLPALPATPAWLPPGGSYVLFVSTIEARKNHTLLFRVWRRMLEEMPRERVPTLVFAGRVGWLVADLMQQLENTAYLDGKIHLVSDVSDADLASLYRGCLFTVFPSFYEGWGLPVTESLAFGKPCIIARGSSLPEAGGSLARYFDAENTGEAYSVIRAAIEDPEGLRAWQADVVRSFAPVPWTVTADAILQRLGLLASPVAAD
jgi:glycosyltransferase involved in cell wall biosynthesis